MAMSPHRRSRERQRADRQNVKIVLVVITARYQRRQSPRPPLHPRYSALAIVDPCSRSFTSCRSGRCIVYKVCLPGSKAPSGSPQRGGLALPTSSSAAGDYHPQVTLGPDPGAWNHRSSHSRYRIVSITHEPHHCETAVAAVRRRTLPVGHFLTVCRRRTRLQFASVCVPWFGVASRSPSIRRLGRRMRPTPCRVGLDRLPSRRVGGSPSARRRDGPAPQWRTGCARRSLPEAVAVTRFATTPRSPANSATAAARTTRPAITRIRSLLQRPHAPSYDHP